MVSLSHVTPELFVALHDAAQLGDRTAAESRQEEIAVLFARTQEEIRARPVFSTLMRVLARELGAQGVEVRLW